MNDTITDSAELCGLEGDPTASVTKAEVNRFIKLVNFYHGKPMKRDIADLRLVVDVTNRLLTEHIAEYQIFRAELRSAKYVLWLIGGMLSGCVVFLIQIMQALRILGVS